MSREQLTVSHTLLLRGADPKKLIASLADLPGIKGAHATMDGRHVTVTYDLELIGLDAIERLIIAAGATLPSSLFERIRLGWLGFTERNARDNALTPVRDCCSRPPDGK